MKHFKQSIMDKTFDIAIKSPLVFRARICSTLVYRNIIICSKCNSTKTHPFQRKYSHHNDAINLHSENHCLISAIRAGFDIENLKYCSLYIARACIINPKFASKEPKEFIYGNVKPCKGCQSFIAEVSIKNVFYTTKEGVEVL